MNTGTHTHLEAALGWLSVRRIVTVQACPRVRMPGVGMRPHRRATPVSIEAGVVLVLDALVQVQAGYRCGHRRRPRKLLEHTTAECGRALSVYGGDEAFDTGGL